MNICMKNVRNCAWGLFITLIFTGCNIDLSGNGGTNAGTSVPSNPPTASTPKPTPAPAPKPAPQTHEIKVLMVVTPAAKKLYPQTQSRINHLINTANQAYKNSGVKIKLKVAAVKNYKIPGATDNVNTTLLQKARYNTSHIGPWRTAHKADLVVVLTASSSSCGVAYTNQGNSTNGLYSNAALWSYSAVGINCHTRTLPHELGHNMGLRHSRAQGDEGSVYPYGVGHGKSGSFVTVMAYSSSYGNAPRLMKFSNPWKSCCTTSKSSCGVHTNKANSAHAAKALNNVAKQVSNWL